MKLHTYNFILTEEDASFLEDALLDKIEEWEKSGESEFTENIPKLEAVLDQLTQQRKVYALDTARKSV